LEQGWIKLHKALQNNWLWDDKPYSRGQAWVDMLLNANHSNDKFINSKEIVEVAKGSFITSEVKLMNNWGWSKTKLRRFLTMLERDGMIIKNTEPRKTTITIVNWGKYQAN